ncbi:general substrate transporter [Periconia macrospinosa]|uniref:General substrate transporter n=1 Tax=Periconia macrospinosa TaxID=97972 RepID=A0A2V1D8V5_9PLEO|nr:general substrate transporter [Periconia macrospinosa]
MSLNDVLPNLGKPWWKVPHLLKLNLVLLAALLTPATNGFDGSMMNGLQTLPAWQEDFNHPHGALLGVLGTISTIGFITALPFTGYIADKLGRRLPIQIGNVVMIGGAILQAGAKNIGMFLAARFLLGFGISIAAVASPALVAELSYPTHRGKVTAIYNTNWFVGSIIAAWSTFGTFQINNSWSWRIPSALQCAPSVIQLVSSIWIPESPRWLIYKDRRDEATKVLADYHAGGDVTSPLVMYEIAEITAALSAEKEQSSTKFSVFLKTPGNRHRLFILVVLGIMQQASGNTLIAYFLALILKQVGITDGTAQNGINGGLQVVNYLTAISSAFLVDRFGRRTLMIFAFIGMFLSYLLWTIVSAINEKQNYSNSSMGIGVVVLIFTFNIFYAIGLTPIPFLYLSEILPYTLRAKGMMISSFSGVAIGLMLGLVNPIALENIGWKYYIVSVVLLAVWTALAWFCFPETKGRSLESIAEIFDGEDALVGDLKKEVELVHDEVVREKYQ